MTSPSYGWRIGLLAALLAVVALQDLLRHGLPSQRWQNYTCLLLGGAMGALFGAAADFLVSSRISPEYFEIGKGLPAGPGFGGRVALLGLQAGFGPGAICMCVFLYAGRRQTKLPPLPRRRLLLLPWMPLAAAIAFGSVIPVCFSGSDPMNFGKFLARFLTADQVRRFLIVWWLHGGLYLGCLIGIVAGVFTIKREREVHVFYDPIHAVGSSTL
jgi:hypothetical protein